MRNVFIKELVKEARRNKDLYVLSADLGFNAFEPFRDEFPDRFINVGVAEANMVGVAAGLAMMGKKVCAYSIVPFATFRCYEQIRDDVCLHALDVKMVGVGGGFSYGNQGVTHNTTEDIAVMRALPNMSVFCPGDKTEAEAMIKIALKHDGPAYLRLGRAGTRQIYEQVPGFSYGKGVTVKEGGDVTLISTGNILETALDAAEALERQGRNVRVISMPCVKPLDIELVLKAAGETKAIFVIEEHSVIGGLGSAVAEAVLESEHSDIVFRRIGMNDKFPSVTGSQQYLRDRYGLSSDAIAAVVARSLELQPA